MAFVAGDITTTGKMMEPAGIFNLLKTAFEVYKEQISYLSQAGVDFIIAETMINIEETLAAVDAASQVCDLPVLCFDDRGGRRKYFQRRKCSGSRTGLRKRRRFRSWHQLFCRTGSACFRCTKYLRKQSLSQ